MSDKDRDPRYSSGHHDPMNAGDGIRNPTGQPYEADAPTGPAGTPDDRGLSGGGLIGNADEYQSRVDSPLKQPDADERRKPHDSAQDLQEEISEDAGHINPA